MENPTIVTRTFEQFLSLLVTRFKIEKYDPSVLAIQFFHKDDLIVCMVNRNSSNCVSNKGEGRDGINVRFYSFLDTEMTGNEHNFSLTVSFNDFSPYAGFGFVTPENSFTLFLRVEEFTIDEVDREAIVSLVDTKGKPYLLKYLI